MDSSVYKLVVAPDGILYAGGAFSNAGGIAVADSVARWNGYTWAHIDFDFPGAAVVYAVAIGFPDPVVPRNYDIYLGSDATGNGTCAGNVTIDNTGTRTAYPRITFHYPGATSAILKTLRNETTGKELLFDYEILGGEILTIDLAPGEKSIVSSFFGNVLGKLLRNSDLAEWTLKPGDNLVTCFTDDVTVEAFILWQNLHYDVSGAQ